MVVRAPVSAEPRVRRWTRDDYHRMAEAGLFRDQRVELIGGEVVEMSPQGNPHYVALNLASRALQAAFGTDYWVRTQGPLTPNGDSEPEPDIAIVNGDPRDFAHAEAHPGGALLVVEISDTSLTYDRTRKSSLYASMGVADYWIVNLLERCVEVRRAPQPDASTEFGWSYGTTQGLQPSQSVAPLARPDAPVRVDDMLP